MAGILQSDVFLLQLIATAFASLPFASLPNALFNVISE